VNLSAIKSIELLHAAMLGLRAISDIAKSNLSRLSRLDAQDALQAIASIVETLNAGWKGDLEVGAIREAIDRLRASLAQNDAAANAELDRKFPA